MVESKNFLLVGGGESFPTEAGLIAANLEVQAADPLGLDSNLGYIIQLNATDDVVGLGLALNAFTPSLPVVETYDTPHAIAALRDLGYLVASLGRLDPGLQRLNSQTTEVLAVLGQKLDMPPRDTLYTYSAWNPSGDRQRTFTGTKEEGVFIDSITSWHNHLHPALLTLAQMQQSELRLDAAAAGELEYNFGQMVDSMVAVRRGMTSRWFYEQLQPYFGELTIAGAEYEPPSGAHMNLLVMDHILWGSDSDDAIYRKYLEHNAHYLPRFYRDVVSGRPQESINTILTRLDHTGEEHATSRAALLGIATAITSFRRVHLTMAREMLAVKYPEGVPADNPELKKLTLLLSGVDQIRQLILANK